jgi:hypothetical protein
LGRSFPNPITGHQVVKGISPQTALQFVCQTGFMQWPAKPIAKS